MWKKANKDVFIPMDSPVAGFENGVPGVQGSSPIFIIRSNFRNGVHPGKWVFGNTAWIPYGGEEHHCADFEVYTGPAKWASVKNNNIPANAVVAGQEADGKKLYVARAKFDKGIFVGKAGAHLMKGCCIGHNGKEYNFMDYEILVN